MAAGFRTIVLAGFAIGGVGGVVLPDVKFDAAPIQDSGVQALSLDADSASALDPLATAEAEPVDADAGLARTEAWGEPESREIIAADPPELCVDQYLWSLYQRPRKVDTIKVVEQKKASVVKKGKLRTIIQKIVKLVREDFTWKDPAAAEKAGMQQMDYVIGGMDRSFKLRLYHALRAMDDAGLRPGITSAFRDDYRQAIASGLKAASNRSYHGGSLRGGYGHGLAADLVSVNGETDAERWDANEKLWNWIDTHGKEFGIGRPYLDKDPPHVAPIDGQEYAAHRRGGKQQYADHRRGRNTRQASR
jgi:hypothetical protein